MAAITPSLLKETLDWQQYYATCKKYVESDERPALYRAEKMQRYTAANIQRMDTLLQHITIEPKLYNLLQTVAEQWRWVVLAEPWCGDVSQILPVLYILASCNDKIAFSILQSDSYPAILDDYLTDDSRSIPILICLKADSLIEIGRWGPRPAELQALVLNHKDDATLSFGDKVRRIHQWYETDKTRSIQTEFIDLIKKWRDK